MSEHLVCINEISLKKGYVLSSILFNLVLKKIIMSLLKEHKMELNEGYTSLTYTNDLVIFGNTRQDVTRTLVGLKNDSKWMRLSADQEKNKHMYLTRKIKSKENTINLKIYDISFQQVNFF